MEFPRLDENGVEQLVFENRFLVSDWQMIEGADCSEPSAFLDNDANRIVLDLTANEFTEIFSALKLGAQFLYPAKYLQVTWNFLKGLHCPPELEDEQGCINFKPSASFVSFTPQDPYRTPDLVPDGYVNPPFILNDEFEYPEAFGYEATDVMVPLDAFPAFAGWDDLLSLELPTMKITVKGHGQIEFDFLKVVLGGYVAIKTGSPPNILDLADGIVGGDVRIIDLNQDAVSLPPEGDLVEEDEYPVDSDEFIDIYCMFIPKIDDSIEFFGLGGGIRNIGLCGLEFEDTEMGITAIRYVCNEPHGNLQYLLAGEWVDVPDWSCIETEIQESTDDLIFKGEQIAALQSEQVDQNDRLDALEAAGGGGDFVQDIRWNDDEYRLEKKINDEWSEVTDFSIFVGYLDSVTDTADVTASSLTALLSDFETFEEQFSGVLAFLENQNQWSHHWEFFDGGLGNSEWNATGGDHESDGWHVTGAEHSWTHFVDMLDSRITQMKLKIAMASTDSDQFIYIEWSSGLGAPDNLGVGLLTGGGVFDWVAYQVPNIENSGVTAFSLDFDNTDGYVISELWLYGQGVDPFL